MIHLATALQSAEKSATVGQLLTTGIITGVLSVAGSLLLARLTFHFVRRKELDAELTNTMTAKSAELEQTLRNQLAAERSKRVMDREQRVRTVLAESAGPLLIAVEELLARLHNIVEEAGYVQFAADWDDRRDSDWSSTRDYFMSSTGYVFARYFAREAILRDRLGTDEFQTREHPLLSALYAASSALSEWPAPFNLAGCAGGDTQVFFWQQRALGEMVTGPDGESVITYAKFLDQASAIAPHLAPLRTLLTDIGPEPGGNCRWQRVAAFGDALLTVRDQARDLLSGSP